MIDQRLAEIFKAKLSESDFNRLSNFIYTNYGIKMPRVKQVMLQSRLQKRLRELNMSSFKEYVDYVFTREGQDNEVVHMIDVVSTNKTDFFREPVHFEFMQNHILPKFILENRYKTFKVWSAGSSSGEEAYTIAISINEFKEKNAGPDFSIYATDISSRILKSAADAIYKEQRIENLPLILKRKYFLRSKNRDLENVRVIPELRRKVTFDRLNFMDHTYPGTEVFDLIFCRNVLIYFDRPTQEEVIGKLCMKLKKGGYFFLGHSESITNMKLPLVQLKPTIFQRQ
jgi:chemotaxis protein methyltransferase CheR